MPFLFRNDPDINILIAKRVADEKAAAEAKRVAEDIGQSFEAEVLEIQDSRKPSRVTRDSSNPHSNQTALQPTPGHTAAEKQKIEAVSAVGDITKSSM